MLLSVDRLILHFEWIFMSQSTFQDTFIPFIQKAGKSENPGHSENLMNYDQSHLLPVLRPWVGNFTNRTNIWATHVGFSQYRTCARHTASEGLLWINQLYHNL
jgi:hypothetical protein